ncbi:MAG TPA: TIGR04283 family arsenosugar biosynthesis glycosyltransferase [Pyrinomonadaceae bacterium]|nr:TIGR04283 family arsenosugar biosynthesis glycosyltransferase [Pyrinomonadaceae bacterium]
MSSSETPALSIIIPALNEAHSIGPTLGAVSHLSTSVEVIVVDGGSDDGTREIASVHGAMVIASKGGRGVQMHKGACAAQGEALWFLHADTIVPADGAHLIVEALHDRRVVAGNFNICFNGQGRAARFMTWLYPQLRRLGLCYGDSAIFVRREAYERVGGFNPFPLFEDVDLMKRLRRRGRVVHLAAVVVTSSRRFEGRSFGFTFARWASLQVLYWLGVKPTTLARMYAPIRQAESKVVVIGREDRSRKAATD